MGPSVNGRSHVRTLLAGCALAVSGITALALRRSPTEALRLRLLRRLKRVAPRRSYSAALGETLFNTSCPVCLCEFKAAPERPLRIQKDCGHALCAECLESWVLHTTRAHLNPSRFGLTRGGDIVSWHSPPGCPLCRSKLAVISECDIREAVMAAIRQQGIQLSTYTSSTPQFAHGWPFSFDADHGP